MRNNAVLGLHRPPLDVGGLPLAGLSLPPRPSVSAALSGSSSAFRVSRNRARIASLMNRLIPFAGSSRFKNSWRSSSIMMLSRTGINAAIL